MTRTSRRGERRDMIRGPEMAEIRLAALKKLTTVDHWRAVANALRLNPTRIGWATKVDLVAYNVLEEANKQSRSRAQIEEAIESAGSNEAIITFSNADNAAAFLLDVAKNVSRWDVVALSWEGKNVMVRTRAQWMKNADLVQAMNAHKGQPQ